MKLQLPAAASVTTEKKGVVLSIDTSQKVYLDDQEVPLPLLQSRIAEMVKREPQLQVILNADQNTPYSLLIRILDDIRLGGTYDVVLEAKKKVSDENTTNRSRP